MSSLISVSPRKTGVALVGSFDPAKFVARSASVNATLNWLEWVGDRFVMITQNGPGYKKTYWFFDPTTDLSVNGTSTNSTIGVNLTFTGIEDGNDQTTLCAVANQPTFNSTVAYMSYDLGMTWATKNIGITGIFKSPTRGWIPDGTPVWLVKLQGSQATRRSDDNGATWKALTPLPPGGGAFAYSPDLGIWVVMGVGGAQGFGAWWSTDLTSWTAGTGTTSGNLVSNGNSAANTVRWIHDRFIGIEQNANLLLYSMDGKVWREVSFPNIMVANFTTAYKVIYGSGLWVIIAQNSNAYAYSIDGITWSLGAFPGGFLCYYGEYGNGHFIFTRSSVGPGTAITHLTYEFG